MLPEGRTHGRANGSEAAQTTPFRALFVADWVEAAFIHYALDPRQLRPHIPFDLDTFEGMAYVSLVAFTQRRLRPALGGRLAEALSAPLACHEFLNVRTYVKVGGERGIHFIAEWIPNRLAALIGPPLYGLPYRVGRLRYRYDVMGGEVTGAVTAPQGRVEFAGRLPAARQCREASPGTLGAFLVERYTAWTYRDGVARRFRIRHEPWPQARLDVKVMRSDLVATLCGGLLCNATPVVGHFSPGIHDVRIGPPERCASGGRRRAGASTRPT
jgi:uncharacterized protein YqjF (DUF2071 family)